MPPCLLPRTHAALFLLCGIAAGVRPVLAQEKGADTGSALPPGTFARVNGRDIPQSRFLAELSDVLGESYKETFIGHVLIDEKAKSLGVEATIEEIELRAQEGVDKVLKENFGGETSRMNAALEERGLTMEGWKRRLRVDSRYEVLLEKLISKDRTISDEGLRRMFEDRYGPGGVQVRVRHIQKNIRVASSQEYPLQQFEQERTRIDEESRARAREAAGKLQAGESFDTVMGAYSDDPRRVQGGVMSSWKGRYGEEFDAAVASLGKGERSDVIKCPDGYRIVECTDIAENEEIHAQHVLVATGARGKGRTDAEALARAREALVKVNAGSDFGDVAKEFSDDPSAARGGDLGWFGRHVMVQAFEDAARAMSPGSVSQEPVRTTFGYHIIKVLEKRKTEERSLRQILVGTQYAMVKDRRLRPALESKARAELQRIAEEVSKGATFADLAKKSSDDAATRGEGGLIKSYREGTYGGEFDQAVRTMKPRQPPKVVTDGGGNLHLVVIDEVVTTNFEKVRESLRAEELKRLPTQQEKGDYVDALRDAATIVY